MRDVERANVLFGGRRAAIAELALVLPFVGTRASMLDVGTGRGDIPAAARAAASTMGVELRTIGLDISESLLAPAARGNSSIVRADALRLPFRDRSVDIVLASQVVHHFTDVQAGLLVREMNRVARKAVVISDLRRSFIAAAGLWAGSFPLGFHPVSRHDGVVSVMRGFVPRELAEIVEEATSNRVDVRRRLGFRLTTHWSKTEGHDSPTA
jgi:2-polyprenyl-3-methyl-5-hydroxy-6-metoxy-1,4-benzoquinol methylase